MRFEEELTYPAPLDRVRQMLIDPEFLRLRSQGAGAEPKVVVNHPAADVTELTCELLAPTSELPENIQAMVGPQLRVHLVEKWQRTNAGLDHGTLQGEVANLPVTVALASELSSASPNTTRRRFFGEVKVAIPFLGGRIEQKAISHIATVVARELTAAQEYLKNH